MGIGDADATLAPWLRMLDDAQCIYNGDCRGDGLASIQWHRSFSNERWMRVKTGRETSVETARLVEFLLLLEKLAPDVGGIAQLARWTNDYARYARPRYANCCMGMCHSSSDEPDPVALSVLNPCSRHSTAWQCDNGDRRVVVGVVVDCVGDFDADLFALLEAAATNPYTTPTLSADFRRVYRELEDKTNKCQASQSAVRIHVRLSEQDQSPASVQGLAHMMSVWVPRKSDYPLAIVGVDLRSSVLRDVVAVAERLPFRQLLVCASACASGYRATPPTKKCDPIDDTTLRHIITKSQRFLQELELCNVHLASFACLTNGVNASSCRLRKLRLREFAMSATSDGGIFASLKDTSHPLYHTLQELEISQTMDSAGGLSFWLEREAGEMLLINDRLVRCVIHQSCAIQPASTHRGFRQTRGQALHSPLLLSSKLAFLGSMPTHLPRDVNAHIMELAGHHTKRYAAMHYQIVDTDKLGVFVEDCKAWAHTRFTQVSNLPCGSYYF